MKIRQKLEIIQKMLGLTQAKLADRFSVSLVTLNSWWNEKTVPRIKKQKAIDELFLEVTGQKSVPDDVLYAKKQALSTKTHAYRNIVDEILQNPDIRDQFILKLTYHSNSIEGSTLTEPDTAAVLFHNVALAHKSLSEQLEAKNHQTALQYMFGYIADGGAIDEQFVCKLHSILMNGVRPDAGMYRNHGVRIVGVNLPTANYVSIPKLITEVMTDVCVQNIDPIRHSAHIHSVFERIHPFSDGNGRVGRLLMNAMLLHAHYAPAVIRQEQKQLYYTYLYKAQTKNDTSSLEDFICDAVIDGFKILERRDI